MSDPYRDGRYRQAHPAWHAEDAPAKAQAVHAVLQQHAQRPRVVVDVGCGTGAVLAALEALRDADGHTTCTYQGWDIAPDAIAEARSRSSDRLDFVCGDFVEADARADLILCLDTFEHVSDDLAFLRALRPKADAFVFRIPLDVSGWDRLRGRTAAARATYGHLHVYTRRRALGLLARAGYAVVHERYHRLPQSGPLEPARRALFEVAPHAAVRLLGGWSLLVLAR